MQRDLKKRLSNGDLEYYRDVCPTGADSVISQFNSMDPDDLTDLATLLEEGLTLADDAEQRKSVAYANYFLFLKSGHLQSLDRAVILLQSLLDETGSTDSSYDTLLRDLVVMLAKKAMRTGQLDDLEAVANKAQELQMVTDYVHPDRYKRWQDLVTLLGKVGDATGNYYLRDAMIERAERAYAEAKEVLGSNPFEADGVDRRDCIRQLQEVLAHTEGDDLTAHGMFFMASYAFVQGQESEDPADLDESVRICEKAVPFVHGDEKAQILAWLSKSLRSRYEECSQDPQDLSLAIQCLEQAMISERSLKSRIEHTAEIHHILLGRFIRDRDRVPDIQRATRIMERLLDKTPRDDFYRPVRLNFLSLDFIELYNLADENSPASLKLLERAISHSQEAVSWVERRPDHPAGSACLKQLASCVYLRYDHNNSSDIEDLNLSIELLKEALGPSYNPGRLRATYLLDLVHRYRSRFRDLGNLEDIDNAVSTAKEALEFVDDDDGLKASILDNMSTNLLDKYFATGDKDIFTESIVLSERAVAICPDNDSAKIMYLVSLAASYRDRFGHFDDNSGDVERAVQLLERARAITPADHVFRLKVEYSYGVTLGLRYRSGDKSNPEDLNRAIAAVQAVVDQVPRGPWSAYHKDAGSFGSDESERFFELSALYMQKYRESKDPADLETATTRAVEAASECKPDNPSRAIYLKQHVGCLLAKQLDTQSKEDLPEIARLSVEGMNCKQSVVHERLLCAKVASVALSSLGRVEELADVQEQAIHLLPLLNPRAVKQRDRQEVLQRFSGVCRNAVADAIHAGRDVGRCLELSELGRDNINSLRFDSRVTDLAQLENQHPALAQRFVAVRDALDNPTAFSSGQKTTSGSDEPSLNESVYQRHDNSKEFDNVVTAIRSKPGFENFLERPSADDLRRVSESSMEAIVVINVGDLRCDAILIQNREIQHVPLPDLSEEDIKEKLAEMRSIRHGYEGHGRKLRQILKWLWTSLVGPILDTAGFKTTPSDGNWPRVWWVPTGLLSQLPLHAAGIHSSNADSAIDRVVSSYSSSIKALMYSRRNKSQLGTLTQRKAILTSMLKTEGMNDLKGAEEEVDTLSDIIRFTTLDVVQLRGPSKAELTPHLSSSAVFHFAGHGMSDTDPSDSCLLLRDWKTDPFTVNDLIGLKLYQNHPWLAYLSACSTGESQNDDLSDESIHLMSACHSAGFQHVVGSLWEISDRHSLDLARDIYTGLVKDGGFGTTSNVALHLHNAVRSLRSQTGSQDGKRGAEEIHSQEGQKAESEDSEDSDTDPGTKEDDENRGQRGVKVKRVVRPSSQRLGDPLIWAAYIHVGV